MTKLEVNSELINGKIIDGIGGLYTVITEDGRILKCSARGNFRYKKISPYPGDNVLVKEENKGNHAIDDILDRKNFFIRPPVANIDIIFITIAAADPEPAYITIDKLLCASEYFHTKPVIVITKSDLNIQKAYEIRDTYSKVGFDIFVTSSVKNDGIDLLKQYVKDNVKNCTAAFAGESGVGKSSLINALFPGLNLQTGEVSKKISRGKHTTRAVTLFPLEDNYNSNSAFLADTPGFGIFGLENITDLYKDDVQNLFVEFEPFLLNCKYRKCTHLREEGCAVIKAIEDGEISKYRHESYVKIFEEIKQLRPFKSTKETK